MNMDILILRGLLIIRKLFKTAVELKIPNLQELLVVHNFSQIRSDSQKMSRKFS